MTNPANILLSLTGGCTEMCWLYAWATASFFAVSGRPFPFFGALVVLVFGVWVTRLSMNRGWRIASVLAFHIIGFACSGLFTLHAAHFSEYPLISEDWLLVLFKGSQGLLEWSAVVVIAFWSLALWVSGVMLARRPKNYFSFCSRFDLGLAAFFVLFLMRLAILAKGEMRMDDPISPYLAFPFVLFGLLSIGISRIRTGGLKKFLPGYRGVGIILGFAALAVSFAGSLAFYCTSVLSGAVSAAHSSMKGAAVSSLPLIEKVLRILFARGTVRAEPATSSPKGGEWDALVWAKGAWWAVWVEKILSWGIWGMAGMILTGMLAVVIFLTIRWLFSRTGEVEKRGRLSRDLARRLKWLWVIMVDMKRRIGRFAHGYRKASEVYGALLRWARRSGYPPHLHETPSEFGIRLHSRFPELEHEIIAIVDGYNREIYGETRLSGAQISSLRFACRTLQSPRYWPTRLKVRFLHL